MPATPHDERVLVLLPTARDGERTCAALLEAGLAGVLCPDLPSLCGEVVRGAGAALLTEEFLAADRGGHLAEALRGQPPWSDLPLVLVARDRTAAQPSALRASLNVTLIERPVRMRSLLSVIRAALRARRHQYAVRDHLAERERHEEALRDADRKKENFLALLAHELRNPLAPIRSGVQLLRLSSDPEVRDRVQQMMERQLGHMVRLIDDLLDVSRINRNKLELRLAQVTLADAVSIAIETARPAIEAAGHVLTVDLPVAPVLLHGDLTRLAQVFANLLTNSARYTDCGGHITLFARERGDEVEVTVRDNGIGIPADALPTIFNLFSQVDRSVERSTGGLGIGLALVKSLVEMHGGTVAAASDGPGRGSAFTVRLTVVRAPAAAPPAPAAAASPAAGRRVLVADDNWDAAESLGEMLRLLGNEVSIAHDGIEAVERAGTFRPQLILMDVGMPLLNGLDATRRIRTEPWGGEMTIIALTGWGQEGDRRRSIEAGCDGHLVKPISSDDLLCLLNDRTAPGVVIQRPGRGCA